MCRAHTLHMPQAAADLEQLRDVSLVLQECAHEIRAQVLVDELAQLLAVCKQVADASKRQVNVPLLRFCVRR